MAKKAPTKKNEKKVETKNKSEKEKVVKAPVKKKEAKDESAKTSTKTINTADIQTPVSSVTIKTDNTTDNKDKSTSTTTSPETQKTKGWGAGVDESVEQVQTEEKKVEPKVSEIKKVKETKTMKVIDLTDSPVTHIVQEQKSSKSIPAEFENLQKHLPRILANHTGFGDITEQTVRETIEREGWFLKEDYAISFELSPEQPRDMKAVIVTELWRGTNGTYVRIPETGYFPCK